MDTYFEKSEYITRQEEKIIQSLQNYITRNNLSSDDSVMITQWIKRQQLVYLTLYKDNILIYSSVNPDIEFASSDEAISEIYEWQTYYDVWFSDGMVLVSIYGVYEYRFYLVAILIEGLIAVVVFFVILLAGIKRYINYIKMLEKEIHILEGGDLNYKMTIRGQDELSVLALSIEEMRKSLSRKNSQNEEIFKSNINLITEMSHDLRTPLTTQMIYLELLKNKKYKDEKQLEYYIEKSLDKAYTMKSLSDNMFEYFLMAKGDSVELEKPRSVQDIFYELLSDTVLFLQQKGYKVQTILGFKYDYICVKMDYIVRIFDNIVSNISKYADMDKNIIVSFNYEKNKVGITFSNGIKSEKERAYSTQLGVRNICKMMEKMNGKCVIKQIDSIYKITLWFPVVERKEESIKKKSGKVKN